MKTKGFTLVELLVVIAILAILATVSVVGYTSFINNANNSAAQSELVQIRDFCISYDLSHGDKDGVVEKTEVTSALQTSDLSDKATNVAWGTIGTGDATVDVVKYTKDSGVAYWNIKTGDISTTAPEGATFPTT